MEVTSMPDTNEDIPVTVVESRNLPYGAAVRAAHLDNPKPGPVEGEIVVSGWALTPDGPIKSVEVRGGTAVVARARAGLSRPDVATVHSRIARSEESGFHFVIPRESLDDINEVTVIAVSDGGLRTPIWAVKLERDAPEAQIASEEGDVRLKGRRRRWFGRRS
jgi:hypothetical protein